MIRLFSAAENQRKEKQGVENEVEAHSAKKLSSAHKKKKQFEVCRKALMMNSMFRIECLSLSRVRLFRDPEKSRARERLIMSLGLN